MNSLTINFFGNKTERMCKSCIKNECELIKKTRRNNLEFIAHFGQRWNISNGIISRRKVHCKF